jgi:hypothetical protein
MRVVQINHDIFYRLSAQNPRPFRARDERALVNLVAQCIVV